MIKITVYVCNTLVNIKINLFFTFIVKNVNYLGSYYYVDFCDYYAYISKLLEIT